MQKKKKEEEEEKEENLMSNSNMKTSKKNKIGVWQSSEIKTRLRNQERSFENKRKILSNISESSKSMVTASINFSPDKIICMNYLI